MEKRSDLMWSISLMVIGIATFILATLCATILIQSVKP